MWPGPAATGAAPGVTPAQAEVAAVLRRAGEPLTLATLSAVTGQHPSTLREHCAALVKHGLAKRSTSRAAGRGRPGHLYTSVPSAEVHAVMSLAGALIGHLRSTSSEPVADAERLGHAAADGETLAPDGGWRAMRVALARWGFDPATEADAVLLRSCPLLAIARSAPDLVCGFHRGLTRGLVARAGLDPAEVELAPFARSDACVLTLATGEIRSTTTQGDTDE